MVVAVAAPLPAAAPSPPPCGVAVHTPQGIPPEAFEDSPGYERWKVVEAAVSKDGETARIRLRHPANDRVIAVLQYRLISSIVVEERP